MKLNTHPKMEQLLKYGLHGNELKHVSEVDNGMACNCVCANCKHPLVAKNNPTNKKVAHFAHYKGMECEGAIETALHLLAKSILQKTRCLRLPDYHFNYNHTNKRTVFKEGVELIFDEIILEKEVTALGLKIIPDAIGVIRGKQIFFEFANTHFIDEDKKQKIKTLGYACVEIDLREQLLDESLLTSFLISKSPSIYWIINPRLDKEYADYKRKLLEKKKLTAREKEIKEENLRKEIVKKFNGYRNDKSLKLFWVHDGRVKNCPMKNEVLIELKKTHFYRHPIIKRIIDGEYWNGQIYGYPPNAAWIFIKKERIMVIPPENETYILSSKEITSFKFFYAGLKELQRSLYVSFFGYCDGCEFSVDFLTVENIDYQVCNHPS